MMDPREKALRMAVDYCSNHPFEDLIETAKRIYKFLTTFPVEETTDG